MKDASFKLLASLALALSPVAATAGDQQQTNWRLVATEADRDRLRDWRQTWTDALAAASGAGFSKAIAAQGTLFDPDRALAGAKLPAGDYRCRVFKLGAKAPGNRDFTVRPVFRCRVDLEGKLLSLSKVGGVQRPVGLVFDDSDYRQIFLGTMMLGDERRPPDYGHYGSRDMAGIIERVGPKRWRLVLPRPQFESLLDVVELVPAR